MKHILVATLAFACLLLSGCIVVIEQAPSAKPAADKATPKPNPESTSK